MPKAARIIEEKLMYRKARMHPRYIINKRIKNDRAKLSKKYKSIAVKQQITGIFIFTFIIKIQSLS